MRPERPALIRSAAEPLWLRLASAAGGLSVAGKRRLLDELEAITRYHRKSLLRLLNRRPPSATGGAQGMEEKGEPKPHPRRRYGPEAAAALVPLWEASDRLCGKRLAARLPLLVESLEHHGHLALEPAVREQVLAMISATIDRLLAPIRKASGGNNWRRPPRAYSGVRRWVPVRTSKGWGDHHEPGWLEIDLVAHCSGRMQGPFLWTLVATDIATGWSESVPILVRDGAVVLTALQLIRRQLPFPLRGIDADNDPVFMNSLMEGWCDRAGRQLVLTRSRAYQSNDQAWVEQKNGMLVRRVVGYQRQEGLEAAQVLGELYGALRLFTNLFQPSFKLKSNERDGGRIKRQHHLFADNEVGRSATSSLAGGVSAGDPGADAQGPGDAGTTDEPPTQSVHGKTTRRQQPGGCCRSGGHLSAQCPPD